MMNEAKGVLIEIAIAIVVCLIVAAGVEWVLENVFQLEYVPHITSSVWSLIYWLLNSIVYAINQVIYGIGEFIRAPFDAFANTLEELGLPAEITFGLALVIIIGIGGVMAWLIWRAIRR